MLNRGKVSADEARDQTDAGIPGVDIMPQRTQEEINADTSALSRECLGPRDPEVAHSMRLQMGATAEEADQTARFWQEHNRQWEEAQRNAS